MLFVLWGHTDVDLRDLLLKYNLQDEAVVAEVSSNLLVEVRQLPVATGILEALEQSKPVGQV